MFLNIVLPFILAIFFAYLIYPAVIHFENKGIKRHMSIIFVYAILISTFVAFFVILVPEILINLGDLVNTLPQIAGIYREKVDSLLNFVLKSGFPPEVKNVILSESLTSIRDFESKAICWFKCILMDSITFIPCLFSLLVSLIITYYILKDRDIFRDLFLSLVPLKYKKDFTIAGTEINSILKNFIQGQLITALIVGALETICLMIIGVKFPFILGVIGGLANIIPYFGPIIGAIPAVMVGLSQSMSIGFKSLLVFIIIQQIDNAFISPKIIEGKLGIHPISTILFVIIGGELFGITGMFLIVPVCASLKVILKRVIERIV
jgi:predicted PurR-regulated permease PerM